MDGGCTSIWLKDPLLRSVEAIMKFFGGYYIYSIDWETQEFLTGEYYAIRKHNKLGIAVYDYHLVDWQFIAGYFNQLDDEKIGNLYSIERFERNEFQALWRSKPYYGVWCN